MQGFQVYNVTSFKDYYDTTLECIDGSSGQVIASVRLDEIVHGFTPDDLLIIYDETESGESFIELRRPILTIEPQIGR